jgi:alpha-N-arabinofuranosidase
VQPPGNTVKLAEWAWLSIWNGVMTLEWSPVSQSIYHNLVYLSDEGTIVLAVWAGLALNGELVPEADLDFYVQDALNEIEFLTGSVDTEYGALRAKIGHPDPWKIRYVEVGNEDNLNSGLSSYKSYRFPAFYKAITEKYPEIQVLASTIDMTIPGTAGGDYHLYDIPDNFITKFDMFDSYNPEHPILLGELFDQPRNLWIYKTGS